MNATPNNVKSESESKKRKYDAQAEDLQSNKKATCLFFDSINFDVNQPPMVEKNGTKDEDKDEQVATSEEPDVAANEEVNKEPDPRFLLLTVTEDGYLYGASCKMTEKSLVYVNRVLDEAAAKDSAEKEKAAKEGKHWYAKHQVDISGAILDMLMGRFESQDDDDEEIKIHAKALAGASEMWTPYKQIWAPYEFAEKCAFHVRIVVTW